MTGNAPIGIIRLATPLSILSWTPRSRLCRRSQMAGPGLMWSLIWKLQMLPRPLQPRMSSRKPGRAEDGKSAVVAVAVLMAVAVAVAEATVSAVRLHLGFLQHPRSPQQSVGLQLLSREMAVAMAVVAPPSQVRSDAVCRIQDAEQEGHSGLSSGSSSSSSSSSSSAASERPDFDLDEQPLAVLLDGPAPGALEPPSVQPGDDSPGPDKSKSSRSSASSSRSSSDSSASRSSGSSQSGA